MDGFQEAGYHEGCDRCPNLSVNEEYLKAFGVRICNACRMGDGGKLITKTQAKTKFKGIITDKDLNGLGTVERKNPINKSFKAMRMYLQSQVEALVIGRRGCLEDVEMDVRRQEEQRIALKIRRKAEKEEEAEEHDEKLDTIRKEIEDTFKKRGEVSMEEVRDRKTGKKMRKIEGGPTIPVEDI